MYSPLKSRTSMCAFILALVVPMAPAWAEKLAAPELHETDQLVVAERGGVSVTLAEIDARVMELPAQIRGGYMNDPERLEMTISAILLEKQLAQKAHEFNVDQDPFLPIQLRMAQDRFLAGRAAALNESKLADSMPDFTLLAEEAYLANPEKYRSPETLKLKHVLVSLQGRDRAVATARANEARELLISGARPFADIVKEFSDERSNGQPTDGMLHDVVRGAMVPPFERAVFALPNVGDVTEVIETQYGLHVAQLAERITPVKTPFEVAKPTIVENLQRQYIESNKTKLTDDLRSMPVRAVPELVASLRSRYERSADGTLAPVPELPEGPVLKGAED